MIKFFTIKRKKSGVSVMELLIAIAIFAVLSVSLYHVLRSITRGFTHSRRRLDILQTTRIIMTGIRNELRNAVEKPQVFNDRLNIPVASNRVVQYYFDTDERRLYRGTKDAMNAPDPDISEMRAFMFDDGQIVSFEYDSSYRDSSSFVEAELSLNSMIWFKVSMQILYTETFHRLSDEEKNKILQNPHDDPRVKSFFMTITPRTVNWLLQATQ